MKTNKYDDLFRGVLRFKNLAEAEETIVRIDTLYLKFKEKRDAVGAARARYEIERGLKRARMIEKNKRIDARKREEKKEISLWFEVWLIDREAFWIWLKLRKARLEQTSVLQS